MRLLSTILALVALITPALAQFQFFEHMFGGQQEHQPQNAGSDSAWYQQNYEAGKHTTTAL